MVLWRKPSEAAEFFGNLQHQKTIFQGLKNLATKEINIDTAMASVSSE